jgi:hypothetical protein
MEKSMRRFLTSLMIVTAGALIALAAAPAAADTIQLDLTGVNLKFAGGQIYDADHIAGGNGNYLEATAIGSVVFYTNDYSNYIGSSTGTNVYADVLINNVPAIPANGSVDSSGGAFVNLLTANGTLLGMPIDTLNISYTKTSFAENITLIGVASATITQNLPFSLHISAGDEVDIMLTGDSLQNQLFDGQGQLVGFTSHGIAQLSTAPVPEPGLLAILLSLAMPGATVFAWRRHRSHGC